jgi:hypothetical protein
MTGPGGAAGGAASNVAAAGGSGAGVAGVGGGGGDSVGGAGGQSFGGAGGDGVSGSGGGGDGAGAGGAAGQSDDDAGTPDAGAGGSTIASDAGPPAWVVGCADGTREGLQSLARYPDVAACSGAWSIAGMIAPETLTPQCNREAGNDGTNLTGDGCSAADLCADGWHVCESAQEFAARATNCDDAFPGGAVKMFFASRQRASGLACDPTNEMGTNNVYGCGNFGSNANADCAPFMRMLRDNDCQRNPPWMCVNGPINQSTTELADVTKSGPDHGGVLCCR